MYPTVDLMRMLYAPRNGRIRPAALAAAFLIFAMAAGCSMLDRGPSPSSLTYSDFETRTLDNPHLKEFIESCLHYNISPWPPTRWDRTMLTLAAYYYHPDLDTARAQWQEARAAVITASRRPNPVADSRYQSVSNPEPGTHSSIVDSNLFFPIEAPGKRKHRIAQAENLREAARLNIERTAWQVGSRVRHSLIDLHESEETVTLLRRQVALQEENDSYIEEGASRGEFSPLEATIARISFGDARLLLAQGEKQLSDTHIQLAGALSMPAAEMEGITIDFGFPDDPSTSFSLRDLRRHALQTRSDLMAALSDYAAARSALQVELAARFPDIQIGPGFEYDQGLEKWGISGSIPLPLFDRNQGPVAEARARVEAAAARCGALQAQIIGEVEGALAAYSSARAELDAAEGLREGRERDLNFLQAMTRPGEVKRLAVYDARLLVNTASISRLSALSKVRRTAALIEDAVQEPLTPWEWTPPAWERNPRRGGGR